MNVICGYKPKISQLNIPKIKENYITIFSSYVFNFRGVETVIDNDAIIYIYNTLVYYSQFLITSSAEQTTKLIKVAQKIGPLLREPEEYSSTLNGGFDSNKETPIYDKTDDFLIQAFVSVITNLMDYQEIVSISEVEIVCALRLIVGEKKYEEVHEEEGRDEVIVLFRRLFAENDIILPSEQINSQVTEALRKTYIHIRDLMSTKERIYNRVCYFAREVD